MVNLAIKLIVTGALIMPEFSDAIQITIPILCEYTHSQAIGS